MRWSINHIVFVLALTFSLTQATSHYSRDESQEDASTQFDLASTFKGGITSNRHHARAHLNSQLYPDLTQLPAGQSGDIDAPSAHESGGSGIDLRAGYPGQASAPTACGRPAPGAYPNAISTGCQPPGGVSGGQAPPSVGYPTPQYPTNPNPLAAVHSGGNPPGVYPSYGPQQPAYPLPQPGYGYPGTYLPQYPAYPPGYYPGYGPGVPVGAPPPPPPPPTSYQNQQQNGRPGGGRDHWDHSFKMKTEYTEDGVHKGPFAVLNNHGGQGYGSGYGGGYNGAFNRPGY